MTLIERARRARLDGDRLEAIALLDESIAARPTGAALLMKAEILLSLGDGRAALRVTDEALRLAPRRAEGWRIKGKAHQRLRQTAAAAEAYGRYLKLEPTGQGADEVRALLSGL